NSVLPFLLGMGGGLYPYARLKVELVPGRAEHLAAPRAGQRQEPHGVRGSLVRVHCQRLGEPTQLIAAEVAVTAFLVVALDALDRVVLAPTKLDREVHRPGQHRGHAVRPVRRAPGYGPVQTIDISMAQVREPYSA